MVEPRKIHSAIQTIKDQKSFIKNLLINSLGWKIPEGTTNVEEISYPWTAAELNAEGLDKKIVDGEIHQIQPLEESRNQPWGIFLLEFKNVDAFVKGRGLTGTLRKVLRGLVRKKRQQANRPAWDRENLLFICTHNYEHYRFAYFKPPKEKERASLLITFGWGPDIPCRTACEFNLPALEWPEDTADLSAWLKKWQGAFDKEALTKEFFRIFAELYHRTVEDIKEVRELEEDAGKLAQLVLDRMLFLYFIQRKGWLDQKQDYLYSRFLDCYKKDPSGNSYYTSFLYLLFLMLSDVNAKIDGLGAVPFLNGGLFEENAKLSQAELIKRARLNIKNSTFNAIFDELLERFNFTVTEDTPLDVEVAIDPEMLGKIFESLILELEREPGKDLRKLTGSYYTPRPIVHFMCEEALKEYLVYQIAGEDVSKVKAAREKIETLLDLPTADQLNAEQVQSLTGVFSEAEAKMLRQSVLDCRVCDPAVGSGAFPVGMLHEMVAAVARLDLRLHGREVLARRNYDYDLKKQIIESCLYGVDIQEQAVRLCELRLWLSLVVDYQVDTTKPFEKAIREVPSLPNLSYRIVRGDSLLERLFGHVIQLDIMARDAKTKQLIESIQADKQAYFREADTDEKRRLELKILAKQAELAERLIEAKQMSSGVQGALWGKEGITAKDRKEHTKQEARAKEFTELKTNVAKAKAEIERLIRSKGTVNRGDIDTLRRQYFHTGEYPTFMWRVDFAEIFIEKGGFDIVVANPPYVEHKKLKHISALLKNSYMTYAGTADLYVYFYEKGFAVLRNNGVLSFISSNKFVKTSYGEGLRGLLASNKIHQIVDFTQVHVFDALVASCVVITAKQKCSGNIPITFADDNLVDFVNLSDFVETHYLDISAESLGKDIWQLEDTEKLALKSKVERKTKVLGDIEGVNIYRGVTTGCNEAFVIDTMTRKRFIAADPENRTIIKSLLQGRNIKRWYYTGNSEYLLFIPWHFPLHNDTNIRGASTKAEMEFKNNFPIVYEHLSYFKKILKNRNQEETGIRYEWYALQRCAASYYQEFEKDKIIWGLTADKWAFAYDDKKHYLPSNGYILTSEKIPLKYLLALVNSKLMQFYFGFIGIMTAGGAYTLKHETIRELPIKEIPENEQKSLITIVNKILAITQSGDHQTNESQQAALKELEKQIDQMVYELYGLTADEIAIVEGQK